MMKLSEAPIGTTVEVTRLNLPPSVESKILSLGFVPGTRVEVVKEAPLGDPRVYKVMGKMVTLRKEEAEGIEVIPIESVVPLSLAKPGEIYEVIRFLGGGMFLMRMRNFGIDIGTRVRVLSNFRGVSLEINGRIARLGHGMAGKILVRRIG